MSDESAFGFPEITDEDVYWAAETLGLSRIAFHGQDGSDPRHLVVKCAESMDVAACPGSGKTTVLVAKLAILARKWTWRTRGMCVLSHTNAARSEIERGLGSTSIGQRLLSYPHFIGTIHGFLNEFLALPWLRSQGFPIRVIDNFICQRRVWQKLPPKWRAALQYRHMGEADVVILDAQFTPGKRYGSFPVSEGTETYKQLKRALEGTALEGFFRHDDSLVWADDLLDRHEDIVRTLRGRFPVLFIDEAQDNSEEQSAIIRRVFREGMSRVVLQRFGDSNQAVFNSIYGKDANTDPFPISERRRELPNSHRFGQKIADLADPLGILPYDSGFAGHGPCKHREAKMSECPHTIFLFDVSRATDVLDSYGQLLVDTFPEEVLREGTFAAVGQVHNPPEEEEEHKKPHHVRDYWRQYDPEVARRSATPHSLVQYISCGIAAAEEEGEVSPAVERIAEGILRLASMANGEFSYRSRRYHHRYIRSLLDGSDDILEHYLDVVHAFAVERTVPNEDSWETKWKHQARAIAEALAGASVSGDDAEGFLAWGAGQPTMSDTPALRRRDNIYRYPQEAPKVEIKVGSIHSVKGQTHTATLVLESFWNLHNLDSLKEWILDPSRRWKNSDGVQRKSRLKLHYVAMTRPTHLLCLAMKRSSFDHDDIQKLEARGWRVMEIS